MSNDIIGNRGVGAPGRNSGGEGYGGKAELSRDEEIIKRSRATRLCLYCERLYVAGKANQRYCDTRCGKLQINGSFSDETYARWARGLRIIHTWFDGAPDDDIASPYQRPTDVLKFDLARRRLYLTIIEIQSRASRANAAHAQRAYKILSDGLLALFELPAGVDLSGSYQFDEDVFATDLSQYADRELPVRGLAGWKIVADTESRREANCILDGNMPRDLMWLDL